MYNFAINNALMVEQLVMLLPVVIGGY